MRRQPVAAAAVTKVSKVGQAGGIYQRHAQLSSRRCTNGAGGASAIQDMRWPVQGGQPVSRSARGKQQAPTRVVDNALPHAPKLLA